MKTIIAGSREITDPSVVDRAIKESGFTITEVVSGACRGVDELGEQWAAERGVKVKRFPAGWSELGKAAGPIRNAAMAKYADALIAIWDGESRGTRHMITLAYSCGLKVFVWHQTGTGLKNMRFDQAGV